MAYEIPQCLVLSYFYRTTFNTWVRGFFSNCDWKITYNLVWARVRIVCLFVCFLRTLKRYGILFPTLQLRRCFDFFGFLHFSWSNFLVYDLHPKARLSLICALSPTSISNILCWHWVAVGCIKLLPGDELQSFILCTQAPLQCWLRDDFIEAVMQNTTVYFWSPYPFWLWIRTFSFTDFSIRPGDRHHLCKVERPWLITN